jgi:hypothetical protein
MSKKNIKGKDLADRKETTTGSTQNTAKKEEMQTAAKTYWEKKYEKPQAELLYGKQHFMLIGGGLLLLLIGFFLMSGGNMPDENTWDPSIIYSFTRITLAPLLVLLGLGVVGYALFFNTAKDKEAIAAQTAAMEESVSEEEAA